MSSSTSTAAVAIAQLTKPQVPPEIRLPTPSDQAVTGVHYCLIGKGQKLVADAGYQRGMIPTWQIAASDAVLEESIAGEQHPFLRQIESYVAW